MQFSKKSKIGSWWWLPLYIISAKQIIMHIPWKILGRSQAPFLYLRQREGVRGPWNYQI
jgi:hypothetical protein